MCISYRTGRTVTDADVLREIAGGAIVAGDWSMMRRSYSAFGLSVQQYDRLSFSEVQDVIGKDLPIHIGGNRASDNVAHSMVMYGWGIGDRYDVYRLYDLFYGVQYMSIFTDDNSSYLPLHVGGLYVWKNSRY